MSESSRILIVEDDRDIREDLSALLEDEGFSVQQAANGREALERLRQEPPPCLIILDLMMPVMNGWDFRREALADPKLQAIPVVVVSGAAHLGDDLATLKAAATFRKPFELEPLLEVIRQQC